MATVYNKSKLNLYSRNDFLSLYLNDENISPILILGDTLSILKKLPNECIDVIMTSPPYWQKRQYEQNGIGMESTYQEFIEKLVNVFGECKRILKPKGSFWLNMGDSYHNKNLLGIPWRIAISLIDNNQWILRNDIIWNKIKSGMDTSKDRLGNVHEYLFHFVKQPNYYYDLDAIRTKPRTSKVINGAIVSATGVSGIRYKRQIELSTALTDEEKKAAFQALQRMLDSVSSGEIADFRMVIRGQQRTTHSDKEKISGRAKELRDKGFYFLRYHPNGSKPTDVWDILPEDTQKRGSHFAAYPTDLCRIPILATCPLNGIVLDPFCGTGTTLVVAKMLKRKSIGIDIALEYLNLAQERIDAVNE